jgi:glycosyltransferase involved in cell wall biosynthesis
MKTIKIHLFHKLPTPYNDMLFRALHLHPEVDLLVHHLWRNRWNRPWTVELATGYPNHYLKTWLGVDWSLLWKALTERESFFLVGDWAHAASIVILATRILMKAPVSIWADTPQEQLPRPWLKRNLRRAFLDQLLPKMDVVFGTGQPALKALANMGISQNRLVNLPCFVDLQFPNKLFEDNAILEERQDLRQRVGCSEKNILLLMAGTCSYKKGYDIGIRAFANCWHDFKNIRMIIAGEGPKRQELENLAVSLGVAEQITFLGWLNPHEMNVAYAACDIVLHTARWDPFPLVILEGMSWGKVVIGSDVCGSVQDRIIHGRNGFVFPSEDVEALITLIKDVVSSPEQMHSIGLEARRTAEQWPVERGVETIVQTARKVLSDYR